MTYEPLTLVEQREIAYLFLKELIKAKMVEDMNALIATAPTIAEKIVILNRFRDELI